MKNKCLGISGIVGIIGSTIGLLFALYTLVLCVGLFLDFSSYLLFTYIKNIYIIIANAFEAKFGIDLLSDTIILIIFGVFVFIFNLIGLILSVKNLKLSKKDDQKASLKRNPAILWFVLTLIFELICSATIVIFNLPLILFALIGLGFVSNLLLIVGAVKIPKYIASAQAETTYKIIKQTDDIEKDITDEINMLLEEKNVGKISNEQYTTMRDAVIKKHTKK